MLPDFALHRATSLADAVSRISEDDMVLAGGTELLLAMKAGFLAPTELIDVTRLPELGQVEVVGDELVIGAGASHRQVARNAEVRAHLPMLARVEDHVGNLRVRAQGTIGGNLCFAEPRSDVTTALLTLDAEVELLGPDGARRVPVEEFVVGPYTTVRDESELCTAVRVPLPGPARAAYEKFQTTERPTVGVAVAERQHGGGVVVAVGAVSAVPAVWRYDRPEDVDPEAIAAQVDPMEDLAGAADYKRHVTAVHVRRAVAAVEAGGSR